MSDVRSLSQRLGQIAVRVGELGEGPARGLSSLEWRCPRGRRALAGAEHLALTARRAAGSLAGAAHELARAADQQ